MRTTQAARLARWSGAIALLLAIAVSGVYAHRAWQARLAHLAMHLSVPTAVQQQTAAFALSKVTGDRTEYTVRASHAIEFREGGRSVLQDVWVTAYGEDGRRFDNLHTRACDYEQAAGDIVCGGDVQMDLQSAEDARLHPSTPAREDPLAQIVHIDTRGVSFNKGTGLATSAEPVTFHFPHGEGRAVGFRYDAEKGELSLLGGVSVTLRGAMAGDPAIDDPLILTSGSLAYDRDQRVIHFIGAVKANRGLPELTAGKLDLALDSSMRAQRLVAQEQPLLRDKVRGEPLLISADQFSADLLPQGAIGKIHAVGNVRAETHGTSGENQLKSDRAEIAMAGNSNQPRRLVATGNVTMAAVRPGGLHENLASMTLEIDFTTDGKRGQAHMASATTPAGTVDWEAPVQGENRGMTQHVHLASQHWDASFGAENELQQLHGIGGAQFERRVDAQAAVTGTSENMVVRFAPTGDWSTIDQTGDVRLREPDRTARANTAHYDHAADTAALSGAVQLSDSNSVTTAENATIHQSSGELHAEGRLSTIEIASAAGGTDFAPGPARITSDRLDANTAKGMANYSGHARLWQGDSVVEAESIELDRAKSVLTANDHVRAVFPEASAESKAVAGKPATTKSVLWHAEAAHMTYTEGRCQLDTNVTAHSDQGSIRSDKMDLFFTPAESSHAGEVMRPVVSKSSAVSGMAEGTGRQLTRAVGFGNVEVAQQDRRGNSARADYTAADGKFVLSGGSPVVHDGSGNSVAGRQLTLFLADDTIVVDSAEGLRTLTLHPVGK